MKKNELHKLKQTLRERHITLDDIARRVGCKPSHVHWVLSGKSKWLVGKSRRVVDVAQRLIQKQKQ